MTAKQHVEARPITRQRWSEIVARFIPGKPDKSPKRQHQRCDIIGTARLAYVIDDGAGEVPFIRTCSVLQISAEGMMLRCREEIEQHTALAIELQLGEQELLLWGQVRHCTQTVGAWKIGVHLKFAD